MLSGETSGLGVDRTLMFNIVHWGSKKVYHKNRQAEIHNYDLCLYVNASRCSFKPVDNMDLSKGLIMFRWVDE